ncbi:MAG: hypothetical protein D6767_00360 [Candidatus Hydrogenedentota bacterium]|nr:MAG: hypothetical protein D6767_00360 [Candidatus Hydrogenedentota bacterium]
MEILQKQIKKLVGFWGAFCLFTFSLSAATVVGSEGMLLLHTPAADNIPAGNLYGGGAFVEFGFDPHSAGVKLTASYLYGTEYQQINSGEIVPASHGAFYFAAMLKYNTPIAVKGAGKFGRIMTRILYALNPWFGAGPGFQINSSIRNDSATFQDVSEIAQPGNDFLLEVGGGFHTNIGMVLNYMNVRSSWRNVYFITDIRYTWNLNYVEPVQLSSDDTLFKQFAGYWNLKFGIAYRFASTKEKS